MSASPNQQLAQSPPLSIPNEGLTKVVVPMPVIQQQDDIYYYVFVKGSLYAGDTQVFGLVPLEIQALAAKFSITPKTVENGVMFMKTIPAVVNALAELGYKIVSSCGETETIFTMQREV